LRHPRRAAAEIPLARFEGARWNVAMCESDWRIFCERISSAANERLTVVLEHFCAAGEDDLPGGSLRWMTPLPSDPPGVAMGAFEARGVVLHGRKAVSGGRDTFFVTQIVVDQPQPTRPSGRRRNSDERQGFLPLRQPGEGDKR
jgi:hypothetical protein